VSHPHIGTRQCCRQSSRTVDRALFPMDMSHTFMVAIVPWPLHRGERAIGEEGGGESGLPLLLLREEERRGVMYLLLVLKGGGGSLTSASLASYSSVPQEGGGKRRKGGGLQYLSLHHSHAILLYILLITGRETWAGGLGGRTPHLSISLQQQTYKGGEGGDRRRRNVYIVSGSSPSTYNHRRRVNT